jgi:hypothetical protein
MIRGPPIPINARMAMSVPVVSTKIAAPEVIVKKATPIMKKRLHPYRSPGPPEVIWSDANTSVYAEMIHCSWAVLGARSLSMVGTAT